VLIVPPAVKAPQAMALARGEDADVLTNRKCSVLLAMVLALAAVAGSSVTAAASESVQAAAPKALRMMPPVIEYG
jgi:hypothetical protein